MKITIRRAREIMESAELVCSAMDINDAVARMASQINAALQDANPLVMVVLRGAVVFAGRLLPQLTFPLDVDSIDVTRYGDDTQGGEIIFRAMPVSEISGRTVLLIDDILDEGITLKAIRDKLLSMKAHKVMIAVFADKLTGKAKPISADFVGLTLPNCYVFGFGMDIHGYWRNLPSIYAAKEQE